MIGETSHGILPRPVATHSAAATDQPTHWRRNKAGYTATPVTCGWAGVIFKVSGAFEQERYSQKNHKGRKVKCDGRTDGRTDKAGCRVA